MNKTDVRVANLISKYLTGVLSEEEKTRFDEWLKADRRNPAILEQLRAAEEWRSRRDFLAKLDTVAALDKIEKRMAVSHKRRRLLLPLWLRYAAVVALLIASGLGVWHIANEQKDMLEIPPGTSKAYLYTDAGMITLEPGRQQLLALDSANTIHYDGSGILYDGDAKSNDKIQNNKLITPRGSEFEVKLSDGTRVWLNSETTLEYPIRFTSHERVVTISGEAFFEVAQDGRPFFVNTREATVQVLGTSFCVTCYPEKSQTAVALEKGSVSLNAGGNSVVMTPGQRAVAGEDGILEVADVDMRYYTAWRHGIYYFDNATMAEITQILGRWYDVEFSFNDLSLANIRFSGAVIRSKPLNFGLDLLAQTQLLRFTVIGEKQIRLDKI